MFLRRGPFFRLRNYRRGRNLAIACCVILAVSVGVFSWFLLPPVKPPVSSDVVVVIAGSWEGRHQLGAELVEDGISKNFVVSNPLGTNDKIGSALCRGHDRPDAALQTWCLQPDPVTTTGEALSMGKLAEAQGWSTATVVTARTHARRVNTMFEQCSNLDVNVVFVDNFQSVNVVERVFHEVGGYIKFWLTNPC